MMIAVMCLMFIYLKHDINETSEHCNRIARKCIPGVLRYGDVVGIVKDMDELKTMSSDLEKIALNQNKHLSELMQSRNRMTELERYVQKNDTVITKNLQRLEENMVKIAQIDSVGKRMTQLEHNLESMSKTTHRSVIREAESDKEIWRSLAENKNQIALLEKSIGHISKRLEVLSTTPADSLTPSAAFDFERDARRSKIHVRHDTRSEPNGCSSSPQVNTTAPIVDAGGHVKVRRAPRSPKLERRRRRSNRLNENHNESNTSDIDNGADKDRHVTWNGRMQDVCDVDGRIATNQTTRPLRGSGSVTVNDELLYPTQDIVDLPLFAACIQTDTIQQYDPFGYPVNLRGCLESMVQSSGDTVTIEDVTDELDCASDSTPTCEYSEPHKEIPAESQSEVSREPGELPIQEKSERVSDSIQTTET